MPAGPRATQETALARTRRARRMDRALAARYPDAHCELDFVDPLELLVATLLSAQTTDVRVNLVTPALFARYPNAEAYAGADPGELEDLIRSTGFFRAKARALIGLGRALVERFDGEVPRRMADLVTLPGVGRKTANVVLGNAFGVPGLPVDTHVLRVTRRLGLTESEDPVAGRDRAVRACCRGATGRWPRTGSSRTAGAPATRGGRRAGRARWPPGARRPASARPTRSPRSGWSRRRPTSSGLPGPA